MLDEARITMAIAAFLGSTFCITLLLFGFEKLSHKLSGYRNAEEIETEIQKITCELGQHQLTISKKKVARLIQKRNKLFEQLNTLRQNMAA